MATSHAAQDGESAGALFSGMKFWISQRCPNRSTFVQAVRSHGGEIVLLENHAQVLIVDHLKKHTNPPNSLSYTFIEKSIANGAIEDRETHLASSSQRNIRPAGASIPAKRLRQEFTAEDDQFLADWLRGQKAGAKLQGNEIYKQLEAANPRHPWQSWRDRSVKRLLRSAEAPVAGAQTTSHATPPTPPSEENDLQDHSVLAQDMASRNTQNAAVATPATHARNENVDGEALPQSDQNGVQQPKTQDAFEPTRNEAPTATAQVHATNPVFTDGDLGLLREEAPRILNIYWTDIDEAWDDWAAMFPQHTASEWRACFMSRVYPEYDKSAPSTAKSSKGITLQSQAQKSGEERAAIDGREDWPLVASVTTRAEPSGTNTIEAQADHSRQTTGLPTVSQSRQELADPPVQNRPGQHDVQGQVPSPERKRKFSLEEQQRHSPGESKRRRSPAAAGLPLANPDLQDPVTGFNEAEASNSRSSFQVIDLPERDGENPAESSLQLPSGSDHHQRHQTPAFDIYESSAIPEGDEENFISGESRSILSPGRRKHKRIEEALQVFGDEPTAFALVPTISTFSGLPDVEEDEREDEEDKEREVAEEEKVPNVEAEAQGQDESEDDQTPRQQHTARNDDSARRRIFPSGIFPSLDEDDTPEPDAQDSRYSYGEHGTDDDEYAANAQLRSEAASAQGQIDESDWLFVRQPRHAMLGDLQSDPIEPDLELPWPSESDGGESSAQREEFNTAVEEQSAAMSMDTQAILNAATLQPDLDLPLPPSSVDAPVHFSADDMDGINVPSSPPTIRSTASQSNLPQPDFPLLQTDVQQPSETALPADDEEDDSDEELISKFIERQTGLFKHSEARVIYALQRTTMDTELAEIVLGSLSRGRGLPDVKGVWTEGEDEVLAGGNQKSIRILEDKHGTGGCADRLKVLEHWKD